MRAKEIVLLTLVLIIIFINCLLMVNPFIDIMDGWNLVVSFELLALHISVIVLGIVILYASTLMVDKK